MTSNSIAVIPTVGPLTDGVGVLDLSKECLESKLPNLLAGLIEIRLQVHEHA